MEKQPIDVIITDLRMPDMDGVSLLEQVVRIYPSTIRMILSSCPEGHTAFKAASVAHQLIPKPCDMEKIWGIVEEACQIRDVLSDKKLVKLITGIKNLPSAPAMYVQLLKLFESEPPTLNKVSEVISMDVSMTAKILQLVNSAFFSIPHKVSNLNQALAILGLNTIKALVLSVGVFSEYQSRSYSAFSIDELWNHSIYVGNLSRVIAASAGLGNNEQDEAQIAGILHDVGKLIQSDLPGFFRLLSMNTKVAPLQMEYHYLGTSHAEIGAYMLSLWGLPSNIVQAVAYHHFPAKQPSKNISPTTAVYIANGLATLEKPGMMKIQVESIFDQQYLQSLKLDAKLEDWRLMARRIYAGERPD
jgi:putative nucleotidyltransferase with HDIG domain